MSALMRGSNFGAEYDATHTNLREGPLRYLLKLSEPRLLSLSIPRWGRHNFPPAVRGRALAAVPLHAEPQGVSQLFVPYGAARSPVRATAPASSILPGEGKPCPRRCSVPLRTPIGRKSQVEGSHGSEGRTPPPYPQVCRALTHAGFGGMPAAWSSSAAASSPMSGRVMSSPLAATRSPGSLSAALGAGRGARPPPAGGRGLGAGRARRSLERRAPAPRAATFMAAWGGSSCPEPQALSRGRRPPAGAARCLRPGRRC